jgi:NADH dehydrogenase FAD-containing subunit
MTTHRTLILRGGVGGVCAARRLDQIFALRDDVEVTLLSGENFLLQADRVAGLARAALRGGRDLRVRLLQFLCLVVIWRPIYLLKLPGRERKVRVALDWTLDLVFPRDIALLKLLMRPPA